MVAVVAGVVRKGPARAHARPGETAQRPRPAPRGAWRVSGSDDAGACAALRDARAKKPRLTARGPARSARLEQRAATEAERDKSEFLAPGGPGPTSDPPPKRPAPRRVSSFLTSLRSRHAQLARKALPPRAQARHETLASDDVGPRPERRRGRSPPPGPAAPRAASEWVRRGPAPPRLDGARPLTAPGVADPSGRKRITGKAPDTRLLRSSAETGQVRRCKSRRFEGGRTGPRKRTAPPRRRGEGSSTDLADATAPVLT